MKTDSLRYISEPTLQELRDNIASNRLRYTSTDFSDLALDNGWQIDSKLVKADYSLLENLDGDSRTAQADANNSLIVYEALKGMTPALAMDERVWVRLSHVECLTYSRARWLPKIDDEEKFHTAINKHFFARGVNGARDDNAISRLWWNMHISTIIDKADPKQALQKILWRADIRQAIVERSWTGARAPLARAILRSIHNGSWVVEKEINFRQLMIEMNRDAGGILFEALSDGDADDLVAKCTEKAKNHIALEN
ncbi:DUF6339 family protein [Stutzerimonas stutzeri]|uniref:DUF6339 family protein n=1 Tax=Stutzerimonas stutzeri TaxID=316 RepID=UPI000C9C08C4|nr:DUF6339 family protein [Stutzerimonas stutzeri]PNG12258.1 hypothetical protein CXK97_20290 [Stutzerimonas stutzeri]